MKQTIQNLIDKANRKEKLTLWDKLRLYCYCINTDRFYGILWLGFAFLFAKLTMVGAVLEKEVVVKWALFGFTFLMVAGAYHLSIDYGRLKR